MGAWGPHRRAATFAVLVLGLSGTGARAVGTVDAPADRSAGNPAAARLRAEAEAAERAGDWEAAFTAYCRLYVADRAAPGIRTKLNGALRRAQQARRFSEPTFRQFTHALSPADGYNLFAEVVAKVTATYADRDRATPQQLWRHGVEEFARALESPAFRRLYLGGAAPDRIDAFRDSLRTNWAKKPIADAKAARSALRELVGEARGSFSVRVPAAVAVEFVCGACAGLDEYTVFLSPTAFASESAAPDLSAHGIYLGFRDGGVVVEGVAVGSWAALHTGIRRGSRVLRVNSRSVEAAGPAALAEALRATVAGAFELELAAGPDHGPLTVMLPLVVPTVYGVRLVEGRDEIGYVRIGGFGPTTLRELDDAVTSLTAQGARVLVLDLRANAGGQFSAGVEVARRFLPTGLIVTTHGQLPEVNGRVYSSDSGSAALRVPLVVLIDGETASAAEVVAAALKDHNRAVLVGTPSFGKGAVQYPLQLTALDDIDRPGGRSGGVRVTIAKLTTRTGPIDRAGVVPHITVADPKRQLELAVERAAALLPMAPMPEVEGP
jgi:C-terminal peptidase prc